MSFDVSPRRLATATSFLLIALAGCASLPLTLRHDSKPATPPPALALSAHQCAWPAGTALEAAGKSVAWCFDFPVTVNSSVMGWVRHYQTDGRGELRASLAHAGRDVELMRRELALAGVPEDMAWLAVAETGLTTRNNGPWGLSKKTARSLGVKSDWYTDPRRDPEASTRAAARYLKSLHKQFGDWNLAATAYVHGPTPVRAAMRKSGKREYWAVRPHLPRSARSTAPRMMAVAIIARHPERLGFRNLEVAPPLNYDSVTVADATSLNRVASLASVPVAEIEDLNPALVRGCTPAGKRWDVRVPRGSGATIRDGLFATSVRYVCVRHIVQRGDTVTKLAQRYQTTAAAIRELNPAARGHLAPGTRLLIEIEKPAHPTQERKPIDKKNLPEPILDPNDELG